MKPSDLELNMAVAEVLGVDLSPRRHDLLMPRDVTCARCGHFYGMSDTCHPQAKPYCSDDAPRRLLWPLFEKAKASGRLYLCTRTTLARDHVEDCLEALGKWKEEWE